MKRPYCCDDSRNIYEQYYDRQQKGRGDFPVYVGRYAQRGHGIGSILSSLFTRALPTLKTIAPHILSAGVDVVKDVASGTKLKDAAIKRIPETLKRVRVPNNYVANAALSTAANLFENTLGKYATKQTGSGKRKRSKTNSSRKRHKKDIFD